MKATVLVDNVGTPEMKGEWGLAILIEYMGKKILLDTGASDLFIKNAETMGIDLKDVDYGVLSHAHFDHSDGMDGFFRLNDKARFFLRECAEENCYEKILFFSKYIGIHKGTIEKYGDRIVRAGGDYKIEDGVYLIPHKGDDLRKIGKREKMYLKTPTGWTPDDFSHEQSLVFETEDGLVIFNSCSHGGADRIIRDVMNAFPEKKVKAIIGGFHLYNKSGEYIRNFSKRVKNTGISYVYTGHCTGDRAYKIMEEELGDMLGHLQVGLVMEF